MAVVQLAYRFALDPTPAQERALRSHAGAARFAWNWGLAKCQERYAAERKWYSAAELHKLWNATKQTDPARKTRPVRARGDETRTRHPETGQDRDRRPATGGCGMSTTERPAARIR